NGKFFEMKILKQNSTPKDGPNASVKHRTNIPFFNIQPKLLIDKQESAAEKEADSIADKVVKLATTVKPSFFPPISVQRKPIEEKEIKIQKKKSKQEERATAHIEQQIKNSKGGGSALKPQFKTEMERGFGTDFSDIRIHSGGNSVKMNETLGAQAFANGNDIYFNSGKFDPSSKEGKRLLAHELTHTLQQKGTIQKKIQKKDLASPRFGGDVFLEEVLDGKKLVGTNHNSKGAHVRIIQQALTDAGFTLTKFGVDGDYGSETKSQVIQFQKARKLPAKEQDGIIGPITMNELDRQFIGHKTEHTEFAGTDQATLDAKTRAITSDEKKSVKEAMSTEVKKDPKTGKDPIFDKTQTAAYKKELKALTEKYVIDQYNHLGKGKAALRKKKENLHNKNDIKNLAKISKRETDKVYGNLKKGNEFVFGTNLFDGWEDKMGDLKGKPKA